MGISKKKAKQFIKFSASSFVSASVEEVLYLLFTFLLSRHLSGFLLAAVPLVIARSSASFINFRVNQKLVFKSGCATKVAIRRYFFQAVPVMLAQIVLTFGIYTLFQIEEEQVLLRGVIYAGVMTVLFVVSFILQQLWVFSYREDRPKEEKWNGNGI
ncbi:MAG: hypothetical protein E7462_07120 [Ruminococcaceae bacterium]|nr:hypothetical protein [Oscillospiraceae bacterium]